MPVFSCGHHPAGWAALLAASALRDWLEGTGTPRRIRFLAAHQYEGGEIALMISAGVLPALRKRCGSRLSK